MTIDELRALPAGVPLRCQGEGEAVVNVTFKACTGNGKAFVESGLYGLWLVRAGELEAVNRPVAEALGLDKSCRVS